MRKFIPVSEVFDKLMENPEFVAEYEKQRPEFELAYELIKARANANLTQQELAEKIGSKQSYIARLEGGKYKASQRTLQKIAEATGNRLRIHFEPVESPAIS